MCIVHPSFLSTSNSSLTLLSTSSRQICNRLRYRLTVVILKHKSTGMEVAGKVVEVGSDVSNVKKGDRVVAVLSSGLGGAAEFCVTDSHVSLYWGRGGGVILCY